MTFTYQPNNDVANFGVALLSMKTRLIAAGWVVRDSGDGREFSGTDQLRIYGNGTDVISVATNAGGAAAYVANDITNRYAWFRLRSPAGLGGCEIVIQHGSSNAGSDNYVVWLVPRSVSNSLWSAAAADNPGEPPAGTLFIPVNAINTNNNTPIAQDATTVAFSGYATTAAKLDVAIGDASEGYAFYALCRTAASRIMRGIMLDACTELSPDDDNAYVLVVSGATDLFAASQVFDEGRTTWHVPRAYEGAAASRVVTDEGDAATDEVTRYRQGGVSACVPRMMTFNGSGNDSGDIGLNPYDGNADVFTMAWWYRTSFPANSVTQGSPRYPGLKGKSRLLALGGGGVTTMARATGQNLIAQSSGRCWLRWDTTVDALDPGGASITAAVTANIRAHLDATYAQLTADPEDDLTTHLVMPEGTFDPERVNIFGTIVVVRNRVWDTVAGKQVTWETMEPDVSGAEYPGPGTFGVHTSDFCIDSDRAET